MIDPSQIRVHVRYSLTLLSKNRWARVKCCHTISWWRVKNVSEYFNILFRVKDKYLLAREWKRDLRGDLRELIIGIVLIKVKSQTTKTTGSSKAESTSSTIAIRTTATPSQVFNGHTATLFSIQCVSPSLVLVSGSEDKTARLWSVSTGACLRTFYGHTGPIYDVAIVDQVTFLTASGDKTIRAWDVVSGDAFRTHENSSAAVTAVVNGDQSGCFFER